ncbi:MAG: ABC transporter permease subunit [Dehalococcoidales bacterium]|nr:ABC transporter permease subunit [Dehalococcoidales bacterium]
MTKQRIYNILKKEWQVMFTEVNSLMLVTLLPVIILAQGLLYVWLIDKFGGESMISSAFFQSVLQKISEIMPAVSVLTIPEQLQVFLLSQFNFYLLLIPVMIAVSFATFSIVDEKQTRSLEALLATPVRTWELLLGKALSGAIPAIIVTWICGLLLLLGVQILGWGHLLEYFLNPAWFIILFLLTPAISILSFLLGVIGSARAKDSKSAQNLVLLIVLPVLMLIGIQISGLVWFTTILTLVLAIAIVVIDFFVLKVAVRLFSRESIIISWR